MTRPTTDDKTAPAAVLIQDFAKDATGAVAPNRWEEDLTDYPGGSTNNAASIPFTKRMDGVSPHVISAVTDDTDRDGKIDRITVEFSEKMTSQSLSGGVTFVDDRANSFGLDGSPVLDATQSRVVYRIAEGAEFDTEATPYFLYNPNAGDVRDANGFELRTFLVGAAGSVRATDGAAPHIVEAGFGDSNANGLLDRVTLVFSERIAAKSDSMDYLDGIAVDYDADSDSNDRLMRAPSNGQGFLNPMHDSMIRKTDSGTGLAGLSRLAISFAERGVVSVDNTFGVNQDPEADPPLVPEGNEDFTDPAGGKNVVADVSGAPTAANLGKAATNGGDTGVVPDIVYNPLTGSILDLRGVELKVFMSDNGPNDRDVEKDRAAPRIMMAETGDSNAPVVPGGTDTANGDGFIDMLTVRTSETIEIPNNQITGIQPFLAKKDDDAFSMVTIDSVRSAQAEGQHTIAFLGTSSMMPAQWDTGERPEIAYDGAAAQIEDGAENKMANQKIMAVDRARPVIVQAVGVVDRKDINVRFSEPVGRQADVDYSDAAQVAFTANANAIFGYRNVHNPSGVDNAGAIAADAASDGDGSDARLVIQVDNTLLIQDVEQDSIFIISDNVVFDFADDNADDDDSTDDTNNNANTAVGVSGGAGVIVSINDAIAPYIVTARTVDVDGDGMVDHIRFQFSEPVDDESLTGYVTADSLSGDASSVWDIADYTGEVWNLYDSSVVPDKGDTQADMDGYPLFADNQSDDDVLYLMVDEGSGPANPSTGEGDTHAVPGILVSSGVTLVDFKPNTFTSDPASDVPGVSTNVMSASDNAGPAIISAMTTSTTTMTTMFSEDVNHATVVTADFVWNMGAAGGPLENSQENVIAIREVTPGVIRMETQPSVGEWPEDLTGTIKLSAIGVVADMSKITNSTRDTIRKSRNQADSLFVETDEDEMETLNIIPEMMVSGGGHDGGCGGRTDRYGLPERQRRVRPALVRFLDEPSGRERRRDVQRQSDQPVSDLPHGDG